MRLQHRWEKKSRGRARGCDAITTVGWWAACAWDTGSPREAAAGAKTRSPQYHRMSVLIARNARIQQRSFMADGSSVPLVRGLVTVACCGPGLWLGGVPPVAVVSVTAWVTMTLLVAWHRARGRLHVPWGVWIGVVLTGVTILQVVPMPSGWRLWMAPGIEALRDGWGGESLPTWTSLSPTPADTILEVARLAGLTGLFLCGAQLSWRFTATVVAAFATAISLMGFVHRGLGVTALFGFYRSTEGGGWHAGELVTPFVNANHQAALFLLGIFCTASWLHRRYFRRGKGPGSRGVLTMGWLAFALQILALLETGSRAATTTFLVFAPLLAVVVGWSLAGSKTGYRARRLPWLAAALGLAPLPFVWAYHLELAPNEVKVEVASRALSLVEAAPLLGIGRGAFADVFPRISPTPGSTLYRHVESLPVTMMVEWGPWIGGAALAALLMWWIDAWISTADASAAGARRLALLGVAAVAVHDVADFAFEFVGVTAPVVALAGGLAPKRTWRRVSKRSAIMTLTGLATLVAGATIVVPHTWANRAQRNRELVGDVNALDAAARWRPLDAKLLRMSSRAQAEAGRWDIARQRALAAVALQPGVADGWLLLAASENALGHPDRAGQALLQGLSRLERPATPALVHYLVASHADSASLALRLPGGIEPWLRVVRPLGTSHGEWADRIAQWFQRAHPNDERPPLLRAELALRSEVPALALHHARLALQIEPRSPDAYRMLARALRSFPSPREREAQDVLSQALRVVRPDVADPLRELLIESLLATGSDADLDRARRLMLELLDRPADVATAKRRRKLARTINRERG